MRPRDSHLFLDALAGRSVSRVPVAPLAVHFCARVSGVTLHRYTSDATALADAVIRYHERFRPDAVVVSADTWVSAEAMGARVAALGEDQPWGGVGEPRVRSRLEVAGLPEPNPSARGRCPLMIEAVQRVAAAIGPETTIVACFDQYPLSLAAALMGINQLMVALDDEPDFVATLMERCLDQALAYGRALAEAGADVLTGGDSPAGLIGPARYRALALPYEQRLIAALKAATGRPVSLHICGDARPLLADMAQSGADVLEIDSPVGLAEAVRAVGPGVALWGNLDPVKVLAQGDADEVACAAHAALAAASDHPRFILGSGCTLAVETPFANVDALIAAPRSRR